MQDGDGARRALVSLETRAEYATRPARRRVTALGTLLRRLRRRCGETIVDMADRVAAHSFEGSLGLAPEVLSAFERGDAAPDPGFKPGLERAYSLSNDERLELERAAFLAADPFLRMGAEAAGDETEEEALRLLTAPIEDAFDDAPRRAAALLRRRSGSLPQPPASVFPSMSGPQLFVVARAAGAALRRAVADDQGRLPDAALTDGIELLAPSPIRVIFADAALSGALFSGPDDGRLAFSGPAPAPQASATIGAEETAGGYVCLRQGVLERLARGDHIARFALCHEIGRRTLGQGATPYFHERHGRDAAMIVAPGLRRRGGPRERQPHILGAAHPGDGAAHPQTWRNASRDKAAATLFAFYALMDPATFSPAEDRLDQWAAQYGAPAALALAVHRRAPELFAGGASGPASGHVENRTL